MEKKNSNLWGLLAGRADHSLDSAKEQELEKLLEESPSLQRASGLVENISVSLQTAEARNRVWKKIDAGITKEKRHRRLRLVSQWSIAAGVAVLLAMSVLLGYRAYQPDMLIVLNQGKEALLFTLPDSSVVWLGGGSSLKYPDGLEARDRKVYLKGEAFFDVRKDEGRTFQVLTNAVTVTVLGTRFDVKVADSGMLAEVVLESGSVRLSSSRDKKEAILRPGEMGRVMKNGDIDTQHVDLRLYTTWKDKYLNVESQRMEDVMFMLSKRYHTEILIEGDELKKEIFSGRFCIEQSLEEIFEAIGMMTPISYHKQTDGSYLILPK